MRITVLLVCFFLIQLHSFAQDKNRVFTFKLIEESRFSFNQYESIKVIPISDTSYFIVGYHEVVHFDRNNGRVNSLLNFGKEGYISSFTTDESHFYVVNNDERTLRKHKMDNEEVYSLKPFERLDNAIFMHGDNYIISHYQKEEDEWKYKFTIYNVESKRILNSYSFVDLLEKRFNKSYGEECADFIFQGWFTSNTDTTFYVSDRTSLVFAFDNQGNLIYIKEEINGISLPIDKERKFLGNRTCHLTPDRRRIRSSSSDDEYLYLLSNILDNSDEYAVIDIYGVDGGYYAGSARVPYLNGDFSPYPNNISTAEGSIIVIYDDKSIVEYKLEKFNRSDL